MPDICTLKSYGEFGEGVFGILAALFWFWSSAISWSVFSRPQVGDKSRNARLNNVYNAIAALFAGIAALLQVFVFYSPACRDFG